MARTVIIVERAGLAGRRPPECCKNAKAKAMRTGRGGGYSSGETYSLKCLEGEFSEVRPSAK
jgi:hypothetical protein